MHSYLARVEDALNELRQGKMVVLTDHPDRENEGDLIFPAENTTPSLVNFMIRNCSGIICVALTSQEIQKLGLQQMVNVYENTSHRGTPFTVSIEAKEGVTTGVSAYDRAKTILTAVDKNATSQDLARPGHVFPLHAKDGGVFERQGHTEGSVDIVRLAGFSPAAVICEIMNPDGTMAKGKELTEFAKTHELKMLSIDDIIDYRRYHENLIADEVTANLPLEKYGSFKISIVKEKFSQKEHVVLTSDQKTTGSPLVRMHSSCMTGDLFGSQRCDCNKQLDYSLSKISKEGGILIYLNQEGRGIGLFNKIKSYALQEKGLDTIEANESLGLPVDAREYHLAANILKNKNIHSVRLLTNSPLKANGLKKYGIAIEKLETMPTFCGEHNKKYLHTKKEKMDHMINFEKILKETHYVEL